MRDWNPWKEKVEMPSTVMAVDDICELLLQILDKQMVEEFAEELLAFHRPACWPEE